jgi:hypothetical protein
MSYSYQPKYPKTKLHEIVTKYIATMRTMRFEPNCSVAFGVASREDQAGSPGPGEAGAAGPESRADVRGWLLKDPRAGTSSKRYLLLEDGDVWREVDAGAEGRPTWLEGPDDDVVTLLAQSQAKARMGGDPYLETEEHVQLQPHVVTDRRQEQHPYQGPERRRRD